MKKINIKKSDITQENVDAIVNAANSSLLGGGGVDGAIHKAAGFQLMEECRALNGCKTGDAKITKGYNLKAKFVIHTVGPIWRGGQHDEADLLYSCYWKSLIIAEENKLRNISFPAISTGVYGYPSENAAEIAVTAVKNFLKESKFIQEVNFICFDERTKEIYETLYVKNNLI